MSSLRSNLARLGRLYRKVMPAVVVLYIVAFAVSFLYFDLRLSVEWVCLVLIGAAILTGRGWTFLKDWGVFIIAVVAWQVTDGLATKFNVPWRVQDMITADKWLAYPVLHGQLPTIWLQSHLFSYNHYAWYDVMSVIVYSMHFLLPLGAGFVLWLVNRQLYYKYAIAFVVAAILGFATYIVYPAVPPWMAAEYAMHCTGNLRCVGLPGNPHPYLPWVYDVWNHTMKLWVHAGIKNKGNFTFGQFHLGFDPVGAMPSEHVMYPTLVFLFFRKQFGKFGYLMIPYILLVIFCIVYMGQHYLIDALVGMVYAAVVYVGVMYGLPWVMAKIRWSRVGAPLASTPGGGVFVPENLQERETAEKVG